jgi:RimJ/RimL family protein N-acetyltransferase
MKDGRVVHRSTLFPPFFRFPFMQRHDLQIGDTWTDPSERGRGLAGVAVRIARATVPTDGRVWYIVDEKNTASIRVIEKAGFELLGRGTRRARLFIRVLGYYALTSN